MDVPDSTLGLTKLEKEGIRNGWSCVRKEMKANGLELFYRFFIAYPSYQKLFRSFANVPLSELKTNKKVGAHATAVMYSIASMVENLDDSENVKELVIKVCGDHFPRGVTRPQFEHLGEVLIAFLEDTLGKLMTPTAKAGWEKLFALIASVADEVLEEKKHLKENC